VFGATKRKIKNIFSFTKNCQIRHRLKSLHASSLNYKPTSLSHLKSQTQTNRILLSPKDAKTNDFSITIRMLYKLFLQTQGWLQSRRSFLTKKYTVRSNYFKSLRYKAQGRTLKGFRLRRRERFLIPKFAIKKPRRKLTLSRYAKSTANCSGVYLTGTGSLGGLFRKKKK